MEKSGGGYEEELEICSLCVREVVKKCVVQYRTIMVGRVEKARDW